MQPTVDAGLYAATRIRITAAVRDLSVADLNRVVPACPEWTVHNLVSHLAGVSADVLADRLEGAPEPAWTAVQVEERRDQPLEAVLAEWTRTGPAVEALILEGALPPILAANLHADAGTHEADLHGLLGTGRPPREIWLAALDWSVPSSYDDAPSTLVVTTPDGTYRIGEGSVTAEAATDTYELFRAVFGRRSQAQIESWTWTTGSAADWSTLIPRLPQTTSELVD